MLVVVEGHQKTITHQLKVPKRTQYIIDALPTTWGKAGNRNWQGDFTAILRCIIQRKCICLHNTFVGLCDNIQD